MQHVLKKLTSNINYLIASVIALLMVLWLASGLVIGATEVDVATVDPAKSKAAPLTHVRARYIEARAYPLIISVKGKTEANRSVDIKAEVAGQVEVLPVAKGAVVKEGDVLCKIAIEDRELRLQEAQAAADQAKLEYDASLRLKSGGFQSQTAIATAKARLEAANADLLRKSLDLQKTVIKAPFDGVVDERPVEIGDLMRSGDVCATLLDLNPLVVSGQLSEGEVVRVEPGSPVTAHLITGEKLQGTVRYIARRADAITRTFTVEAAIPNPDMSMYSGITADLRVQTGEIPAHLISSSLLILDAEGRIGVRYINADNRVEFANVQLVGDDPKGVWVQGLPARTLLITVGQEYVTKGEEVQATIENDSTLGSTLSNNDAQTTDLTSTAAGTE